MKNDTPTLRRIVISSWIGNTIEYYDFLVYGLAAALVFRNLFFPANNPVTAMLAVFATVGIGFVARPLGGILCGHLGDTLGRKKTLVITLVGMGLVTFSIGLLPTYYQIGVVAPILLVMLRFLQGFAVGGEWSGAMLTVVENAPPTQRGFLGAIPQIGGFSGQLLATAAFALVTRLPQEQLMSWGWRIPFLLSAVLVGVGLYIRIKLDETPAFKAMQACKESAPRYERRSSPVIKVLRQEWRSVLLIMMLRFTESVPFFMVTVFAVSYATQQLGIDKQTMLTVVMLSCVLAFPMHALFGALSDKFGRRPIFLFGTLVTAVFTFPFFYLLENGSFLAIACAYIVLINIGHNSINAVEPAFFIELFVDPRIRYSGVAIGSQLGSIAAGGFAPFIAASLMAFDNNHWRLIACYMLVASAISVVAIYLTPETSRRPMIGN